MKSQAALLWLALALVLPLAAGSYVDGSTLTVAAPATVEGLANTLVPAGIASFIGPGNAPILLQLHADEITLQILEYLPCSSSSFPGGIPTGPGCTTPPVPRSVVLSDVTLTVIKPTSAFKIIVTTDRQYADSPTWSDAGNLLVATGGTTRLGTNTDAQYIHIDDSEWSNDARRRPYTPYTADAASAEFTASGGGIQAVDGFETYLQGVQASVAGTTQDGKAFKETFDTRTPRDGEPWRALVAEASGGELAATSTAPFVGFAPPSQRPITDVHVKASFTQATGTVREEGGPTAYDNAPATLAGPLSLRLDKIEDGRLTYTISDGLKLGALAEPNKDDKAIPPAALAAAGAAGAGGAGALAALAFFWPRLKYAWTLLFLPMYTRIERDAVLEHEKRDELYELIRVTPGIHAHEIGEKARIGWGTTVYHLKLLENHGLIVSKKTGRYKRFFVNTGEYTKKKDIYGALRNETAKNVADYIVKHPGTTQKEMCAALSIQPSLASWHVEKLEGVELVKRVKDGRMVRYFAGPAWAELNVRIDRLGGADTPAET